MIGGGVAFGMPINVPKREKQSAYTRQLKLEIALPRAIDEKMNVDQLARAAGVGTRLATEFVGRKVKEFALQNKAQFFPFEPRHGAVFNGAATRNIELLETLNAIPPHKWTAEDRKLERHALACIKAIHPFLQLAALASPVQIRPLSVSKSPKNIDETEEETDDGELGDGL